MSSVPPELTTTGESLILYRLNELSRKLDEVVPKDVYELRHERLSDRVTFLERVLESRAKDRKAAQWALFLASLSPVTAIMLVIFT